VQAHSSTVVQSWNLICAHPGSDLLFADFPDGLWVPTISRNSADILRWNIYSVKAVESFFEFYEAFLQDTGSVLVVLPENVSICSNVQSYTACYDFKLFWEWWSVNEIPLASPFGPSMKVCIIPLQSELFLIFKLLLVIYLTILSIFRLANSVFFCSSESPI
jgi:hypothetical protein